MNPQHPANHLFEQALAFADPSADALCIQDIVPARISAKGQRDKLEGQYLETTGHLESHPVVGPWYDEMPADILRRPDDTYRARHGWIRVEERHTHPAAIGSSLVGYVAASVADGKGALMLMVANSASKDNVRVGEELRNAWCGLVVAAWNWSRAARALRFPRDDRMGRADHVIAPIVHAVRSRPGGRLFWGNEELDPHRDGWRVAIGGTRSTEDNEGRKAATAAGSLRKVTQGLWPLSEIPVGLRRPTTLDSRGREKVDASSPLEPDPSQSEVLTMVLTRYSKGDSKATLAVAAAFMGARSGHEELLLPKVLPLLVPKRRLEAVDAAGQLAEEGLISRHELDRACEASKLTSTSNRRRSATATAVTFVNRIVKADHLRSGVLQYLRAGSTPGRTDYNGWTPTFPVQTRAEIPEDGSGAFVLESDLPASHPFWSRSAKDQDRFRRNGFWLIDIPCGPPITLDAAIWARVDARRKRDGALVRARRSPGRPSRPLAGLICDAGEISFAFGAGGDDGTYAIEVAPPDEGATCRSRADWIHQHTVCASAASQRLGKLLADVARRVESGPLPVIVSPREEAALSQPELDTHALNLELEEIDRRLDGYARDMAQLGVDDRRYRAIERARDADEARATEIEMVLRDPTGSSGISETDPVVEAEAITEDLTADSAQLTVVAGGLERCTPKGPAGLRDALVWMLDGGRGLTNLRSGAHSRQLLIDVRVRLPLADGSVEWIDAGTLDLTDRRQRGPRAAEFTDDAARRLLWEREPAADVAERYGWEVGELQDRVGSWISRVIPSPWVRIAAMTAASSGADIVAPRLIYAGRTGDSAAVEELRTSYGTWAVSAAEAAYLDSSASWAHGTGWVRKPLVPWRSAMAAVARSGPVRRNSLIAAVPDLNNDEQLKDGLHPGRTRFWQPPLALNDGWVSSHRCTRPGCPGGGDAPMTGFLPVPELVAADSAVFCRYCGCPRGTDTALPAVYLKLWDVGTTITAIKKTNGIPHLADEPPVPPMLTRTLRTRDVAERFDLPHHSIQRLAERGALPSKRSSAGKLLFDEADLSRPDVVEALRSARQGCRRPPVEGRPVDGVTAAAHLGVSKEVLRHLVGRGVIANVGTATAPRYSQSKLGEVLAELRSQLDDPNATFADTRLLHHVAEEIAVAPDTVLRMIREGTLASVTVSGLTVVVAASLRVADPRLQIALDPQRRLTARNVADRWGVREGTVLFHANQGRLPSVQFYPRGRRYFIESEVEAWLDRRAA